MRFDHAVLLAADAERTTEWYQRVLGATIEHLAYGRIAVVLGDARLHVQFPTSTPNPRPVAPAGPGASDFCLVWDGPASSPSRTSRGTAWRSSPGRSTGRAPRASAPPSTATTPTATWSS